MRRIVLALLVTLAAANAALAQPAVTIERVTFDEAVRRALVSNPTLGQAAQAIVRAEGLLQQSRAAIRPALNLGATNILNNASVGFGEFVASPRNQSTFFANANMPVLAASQWAAVTQARDQIEVARLSAADVRQQIAASTAQAYLEVVAWQHQVDVNVRARESAAAHLDYAQRRLAAGAGTRLNELRAAQEVSADEARVEATRLALRRAQEALGVLMVAAFSVGLAATLVSIGVAAAWGARRASAQWPWFDRAATKLPYLSAVLVMVVGAVMTAVGLNATGLLGTRKPN